MQQNQLLVILTALAQQAAECAHAMASETGTFDPAPFSSVNEVALYVADRAHAAGTCDYAETTAGQIGKRSSKADTCYTLLSSITEKVAAIESMPRATLGARWHEYLVETVHQGCEGFNETEQRALARLLADFVIYADWADANLPAKPRKVKLAARPHTLPVLVYAETKYGAKMGQPVCIGDAVVDFRGETSTVQGWCQPSQPGSTGRVIVGGASTGDQASYYPSVYGLAWQ